MDMKTEIGIIACTVCVEDNGKFLFIRRAAHEHMPNLLEFPGGKLEKGESFEQAAKRELFEETGIKRDKLIYVGKTERYVPEKQSLFVMHHFYTQFKGDEIKLSTEHSGYLWLAKEQALKMKTSTEISLDDMSIFPKMLEISEKLRSSQH